MNTTFIIGNGFDICQNMATRYCQFYENHYMKLPVDGISPALKSFRQEITDYVRQGMKADKDEIDWSDLEIALGRYAEKLDNAQDYIAIALDINKELMTYIYDQEQKFTISEKEAEKIYSDIIRPDEQPYLNYEDAAAMKNIKASIAEQEYINFISFNYTNTIEKILDTYTPKSSSTNSAGYLVYLKSVLHIHSQLGVDPAILVGVNDPSQIHNEKFRVDHNVLDIFVKPETNKMFGNGKINQAKRIIGSSRIFVLYGVSLGETDKMWWRLLGNTMLTNNAHLMWFVYENPKEINPLLIGQKKRALIKQFCDMAGIADNMRAKISALLHIGYNTSIFSTKNSKQ